MSFQTTNMSSLPGRLSRLFRLDLTVFDEIRSDPSATRAAIVIVLGASLLAGAGSWLWAVQTTGIDAGEVFIKSFIVGGILQTFAWFIWVYLAYQVLARAYGARGDFFGLIRTMGFAFAPVGISILVAITAFAVPFGVIALAAAFLLSHFAIESVSSADRQQTLVANFVGFVSFAVIMGILANISEVRDVGGLAPGLFFFSLDVG